MNLIVSEADPEGEECFQAQSGWLYKLYELVLYEFIYLSKDHFNLYG